MENKKINIKKQMIEKAIEEMKKNFDGDIIMINNDHYNYFKYIIYDKNIIVYIQVNDFMYYDCFTAYNYGLEIQQKSFFEENISNTKDLIKFIKNDLKKQQRPVKKNKDRLSWDLYKINNNETELRKMKKIFGYREKNIFDNLFYIKIEKYDNAELITFYNKELHYFQYSVARHSITN